MTDFAASVAAAYKVAGAALDLGRGVHSGELHRDAVVQLPLAMLNRHGLVAGATGTGKTKSVQMMAEQLSAAGVPCFVADVKGDVSGLAAPGAADGPARARMADLGLTYTPAGCPVEFFSIGGIGPGTPIRATVEDFGPQLLAKILEANETQEDSLTLVFHYADQKDLPLIDLADLRALLTFLDSKEGKEELEGIGGLSKATVGVLLRSLVELETGGGTEFFGEPQLDVADLMRVDANGRGIISVLELPAVQEKPRLWSTVLMWLVAELFETLPEAGDLPKPKLVFFLDEAHLLFTGATKSFVESVTQTVRLIRSKGVGVFFITQQPTDVPGSVLGQLGSRVQHALRAFTPDDAKALKQTVETYPTSDFYDVGELLTSMGTGEAAVTILSESGVPTPVVHTRMRAPQTRMAPADAIAGTLTKYATRVERESAAEMLDKAQVAPESPAPEAPDRIPLPRPTPRSRRRSAPRPSDGGIGDYLNSREGKAMQRKVVRGLFGMLRKSL